MFKRVELSWFCSWLNWVLQWRYERHRMGSRHCQKYEKCQKRNRVIRNGLLAHQKIDKKFSAGRSYHRKHLLRRLWFCHKDILLRRLFYYKDNWSYWKRLKSSRFRARYLKYRLVKQKGQIKLYHAICIHCICLISIYSNVLHYVPQLTAIEPAIAIPKTFP